MALDHDRSVKTYIDKDEIDRVKGVRWILEKGQAVSAVSGIAMQQRIDGGCEVVCHRDGNPLNNVKINLCRKSLFTITPNKKRKRQASFNARNKADGVGGVHHYASRNSWVANGKYFRYKPEIEGDKERAMQAAQEHMARS